MVSEFFEKFEYRGLSSFYKNSPRNPNQKNAFNASDSEVIQLKKNQYLTVSTDSLAIEIHDSLYKLPETWGHLAIANSISDLATSGAEPIGILVSTQWKKDHQIQIKNQVYKAMAKALREFKVPLLGGDSGSAKETVLTTTIIGQSQGPPLTRVGVKPGDLIILLNRELGFGPSLAYDFLKFPKSNRWERKFRPQPDWRTTHKFRRYFQASIDSSDGIFNSLDTLGKLNKVQFKINLEKIVLPASVSLYLMKYKIPRRYFIESDLGDLQTIVAVRPQNYPRIRRSLPFHQIVAVAEKKADNDTFVYYADDQKMKSYHPLPEILERSKMQYDHALRVWMSQFSKS